MPDLKIVYLFCTGNTFVRELPFAVNAYMDMLTSVCVLSLLINEPDINLKVYFE